MAEYRKEHWTAADVRCPFYISDNRKERSISCEGYCQQTQVVSCFKTMGEKDSHMGVYCVGRFERCPMYRCIYEAKYRDD